MTNPVAAIDLPPGWKRVPAGRLLVSRNEFGEQLPLLSVSARLGIQARAEEEGRAASDDLSEYRVVRRGDLVVNRLVAKDGAFGRSTAEGLVSPAYWVLRPRRDGIDTRFVDYLLHSRPYLAELGRRSKYMPPAQFDLPWEQFKTLALLVGSRSEQSLISNFLDHEDDSLTSVIRTRQAQLERLDDLRSSIVREEVSHLRHRPLKYGWRVIDCKHRTPEYVWDGRPVISTREVERGSLDLSSVDRFVGEADYTDLREGWRDPRSGDIVYSRNASVGIAALVDVDMDVCMGQDVVLITRRPRESSLLAFFLNWGVVDQVEAQSIGSTFSRINVPTIRSLVVPDDNAEAEGKALSKIVRRFESLAAAERTINRSLERLAEYREALITEAVTGQLDVTRVSDAQMDERAHAAMEGEPVEAVR